MNLDPPEEVGLTYVLASDAEPRLPANFVRNSEIFSAIDDYVVRNLSKHEAQSILVHEDISNWLFEMFVERGVIELREAPFAGNYYKFNQQAFQRVRPEYLKSSSIHKIASEIGGRYYQDAFEAIAQSRLDAEVMVGDEDNLELADSLDLETVPASDRIVRLDHNQQSEVVEPVGNLIEIVEAENTIDGEDGLRELVLGRLRAGRELIKAGIFSAQSIHLTLVVGLQLLIEKYKEHAIGAAASALLSVILKHIGIL